MLSLMFRPQPSESNPGSPKKGTASSRSLKRLGLPARPADHRYILWSHSIGPRSPTPGGSRATWKLVGCDAGPKSRLAGSVPTNALAIVYGIPHGGIVADKLPQAACGKASKIGRAS